MKLKGKLVPFSTPINKSIHELALNEVFTRHGERFIFTRMKQGAKSFVATKISDSKSYSCKIYGDYDTTSIGLWDEPAEQNDIDKLKAGDLFVINHKDKDCLLFSYVDTTRSGKIRGRNPITKLIWTLDKSYNIILVDNLKK